MTNLPPGSRVGMSVGEALRHITDYVQHESVAPDVLRKIGQAKETTMDAWDVAKANLGKKKRRKYGNVKTTVDGITFDSKKEANRYLQLKAMLAAGEITNLHLQPEYCLHVNGTVVAKYKADFRYELLVWKDGKATWNEVTEDCKGGKATKTPVYRLKAKLLKAIYGIEINEV